ncbi:MAG: glucose-6-phosphate isomerase [Clostridia bacterium]|nr:glucose-6-phosphate isomerase [Clostridia bacterium]
MSIKLNESYLKTFVNEKEINDIWGEVLAAQSVLNSREGKGNDFLGWIDLPDNYDKEEFSRIKKSADKIISDSDILIVIGIGGSYLGARAAIEFLNSPMYNNLTKKTPDIYFAGNNISSSYLSEILSICQGKEVSINVISKSGTTTEPAIAFRLFRKFMEDKYGKEEAAKRIYVTTDKERGTLKELADEEGYETFVVPDDVGGRFSVLTAVGLLPIAVSGADIDKLMKGASDAKKAFDNEELTNSCLKYVALRNIFHRKGKSIEMLINYEPALTMFSEWWKQLYGESEGKDQKGIFPASANFSTDLHSLGQFIQDGTRLMFETVLKVMQSKKDIIIEEEDNNGDGLNFLKDKTVDYINDKAFLGTVLAHADGGVPNIVIEIDKADEENLGQLIYFFEKACGISGYLLGVNPFDQPGVEEYKKNMFALLGKPGHEERKEILEKRLGL